MPRDISRKKKKKNDNMVVNVTKILHKMKKKKKKWLSIEENITKWEITLYYDY